MVKPIFFRIIAGYFIAVALINILFWSMVGLRFEPTEEVYRKGIVIRIEPLDYAMVFAHGWYQYSCIDKDVRVVNGSNITVCLNWADYHVTYLNYNLTPTIDILDTLHSEGYDKVWLSQCHTGDNPYMIKYYNGSDDILWYDWVSRKETEGRTIPIFTGFGFARI